MEWELAEIKEIIRKALGEDIGTGDITTDSLIPRGSLCKAVIRVKDQGVVAGLPLIPILYHELDDRVRVRPLVKDGDEVEKSKEIIQLEGPCRSIITGERVALNFLQRLSGIATLTREFVEKIKGTKARILDTRKTTPNLRILEKYAVLVGGGENYRFGLFDMVMIKDNHIAAVGGMRKAVEMVKSSVEGELMIVVEAKNIDEVKEALSCPVDRIMLDNMSSEQIREAVALVGGRISLEASGNITLERIGEIAETGVDYISIGALTTRFRSLDMSLSVV